MILGQQLPFCETICIAISLFQKREYTAVVNHIDNYLKSQPKDSVGHTIAGAALFYKEQWEKASEAFHSANKHDKNYSYIHNEAVSLMKLNRLQQAQTLLLQAYSMFPNNATLLHNLHTLYSYHSSKHKHEQEHYLLKKTTAQTQFPHFNSSHHKQLILQFLSPYKTPSYAQELDATIFMLSAQLLKLKEPLLSTQNRVKEIVGKIQERDRLALEIGVMLSQRGRVSQEIIKRHYCHAYRKCAEMAKSNHNAQQLFQEHLMIISQAFRNSKAIDGFTEKEVTQFLYKLNQRLQNSMESIKKLHAQHLTHLKFSKQENHKHPKYQRPDIRLTSPRLFKNPVQFEQAIDKVTINLSLLIEKGSADPYLRLITPKDKAIQEFLYCDFNRFSQRVNPSHKLKQHLNQRDITLRKVYWSLGITLHLYGLYAENKLSYTYQNREEASLTLDLFMEKMLPVVCELNANDSLQSLVFMVREVHYGLMMMLNEVNKEGDERRKELKVLKKKVQDYWKANASYEDSFEEIVSCPFYEKVLTVPSEVQSKEHDYLMWRLRAAAYDGNNITDSDWMVVKNVILIILEMVHVEIALPENLVIAAISDSMGPESNNQVKRVKKLYYRHHDSSILTKIKEMIS